MSDEIWHFILEGSKTLIAPMIAVLGYYLSGVKSSLKQLEADISAIKNSLGINSEKMNAAEKSIEELKHKMDTHDRAFIDFYKEKAQH